MFFALLPSENAARVASTASIVDSRKLRDNSKLWQQELQASDNER